MGGLVVLVAIVIGALLVGRGSGPVTASSANPAAEISSTPTPSAAGEIVVTATFELTDQATADASCDGQGGYADIDTGTPAVIYNGSGEVIGSSTLPVGEVSGDKCTWTIIIDSVPDDEAQYAFEVANRGKITQSKAVMEASDWTFATSLGE